MCWSTNHSTVVLCYHQATRFFLKLWSTCMFETYHAWIIVTHILISRIIHCPRTFCFLCIFCILAKVSSLSTGFALSSYYQNFVYPVILCFVPAIPLLICCIPTSFALFLLSCLLFHVIVAIVLWITRWYKIIPNGQRTTESMKSPKRV